MSANNTLNELKINVNITPNTEIIAKVTSGARGKSAYDLWYDDHPGGTIDEFWDWLKRSFVYNQLQALSTWVIKHDLNKYPSVTVVDTADRIVYGDVQYGRYVDGKFVDQLNYVTVSFAAEFSGQAFLN